MIHHHEGHEPSHPPVITNRWRNLTIGGNLVIGIAELLSGRGNTLAVTIDGLHNVGDAATYHLQAGDLLDRHDDETRLYRRRKIAHWIISGGSAVVAAKAGYDFAQGEQSIVEPLAIGAASGSVLLNLTQGVRLWVGIRREHRRLPDGGHHCHGEDDIVKHMAVDSISAVAAFGGAVLQHYGFSDLESLMACASGVLGAFAFAPTEANLSHDH